MGAAAQTDPVLSLLFFYTYRLTMTLAVFPLLFAFIIQAFITRRDLDAHSKADSSSSGGGGPTATARAGDRKFDDSHRSTSSNGKGEIIRTSCIDSCMFTYA